MEDYLQWKRSTTKNPATAKMYAMWVKRFLAFVGENEITLGQTTKFKEFLVDAGYSPKNIQYGMTLVRDYLSFQVTMHGLDFPLKLLKIPQEYSNSHRAITHEEYLQMLSVLPTNHPLTLQKHLIVSLLFETGMRIGELCRLNISDIKGRSAVIRNEKNHRTRLVAWSERAEGVLQFYLPLRQALDTDNDYLFVSFLRRPRTRYSTRQVERFFKEVCKQAGLPDCLHPHGMRHGFTHQQLKRGQSITTIAQMLGHSTVFNVLTYARLSSPEIRESWGLDK